MMKKYKITLEFGRDSVVDMMCHYFADPRVDTHPPCIHCPFKDVACDDANNVIPLLLEKGFIEEVKD